MARLLGLWGPVAAWMALIFGFSAMQAPPGGASVPDWASHATVYCALAVLVCRALAGGVRPVSMREVVLAVALSTLYGVSDEWHQSFVPHRTPELADVMKDLGGAVAGAMLFHLLTGYLQGVGGSGAKPRSGGKPPRPGGGIHSRRESPKEA